MRHNYKREDLMMIATAAGLKAQWHPFGGEGGDENDGIVMVNNVGWHPYDSVSAAIELADSLRFTISFKDRIVLAERAEFRATRDIDKEESHGRRYAMCRAIVDLAIIYTKAVRKYS